MTEIYTTDMFPYNEIGSSGLQRKWISKSQDLIVKEQLINKFEWRDDLVEVIGSTICNQLKVPWLSHIRYEPCTIVDEVGNKTHGCFYRTEGLTEEFVEMYKVLIYNGYKNEMSGIDMLSAMFKSFERMQIRNAKEYLAAMFLVDYLICNTSRSLRTFGVSMINRKYPMKMYPIGDFGGGLFQGLYKNVIFPVPQLIGELQYGLLSCTFQQAMVLFMRHTNIMQMIPKYLDVTGLEFPNDSAVELFCIQCKSMNILVKGVM